jgi:hypothetical protein
VNDIAVVAGFPAKQYVKKTAGLKASENFLYADFGRIEPKILENNSTALISYDELDLMTTQG